MLKSTAIMTGQAVDEGDWFQHTQKHLTLEETEKDSLSISAIADIAVINLIAES